MKTNSASDTCSALGRICIPGSKKTFLSIWTLHMRQFAVVPPGVAQLCYTITFFEQGKKKNQTTNFCHDFQTHSQLKCYLRLRSPKSPVSLRMGTAQNSHVYDFTNIQEENIRTTCARQIEIRETQIVVNNEK